MQIFIDNYSCLSGSGGILAATEFKKALRFGMKVTQADVPDSDIAMFIRYLDVDGGGDLSISKIAEFIEHGTEIFEQRAAAADGPRRSLDAPLNIRDQSAQSAYSIPATISIPAFSVPKATLTPQPSFQDNLDDMEVWVDSQAEAKAQARPKNGKATGPATVAPALTRRASTGLTHQRPTLRPAKDAPTDIIRRRSTSATVASTAALIDTSRRPSAQALTEPIRTKSYMAATKSTKVAVRPGDRCR